MNLIFFSLSLFCVLDELWQCVVLVAVPVTFNTSARKQNDVVVVVVVQKKTSKKTYPVCAAMEFV